MNMRGETMPGKVIRYQNFLYRNINHIGQVRENIRPDKETTLLEVMGLTLLLLIMIPLWPVYAIINYKFR